MYVSNNDDDDYSLPRYREESDQETLTKKEEDDVDEPHRCCSADCMRECRSPGVFSIQEGDKILDIPASFGPSSLPARMIKFSLMVLFNATLIYDWCRYGVQHGEHSAFYLAYMTHWSMILSSLWLIVSFINSIFPPTQPEGPLHPVSLWIKFSWLLFTMAAHLTLFTVVLYWTLIFVPGEKPMTYTNAFSHAGVILIWPEGLIVNRIPIRWKHLPLPMVGAACYISWLVIHQLVTEIGVPTYSDNDPETNDDLIYPAVDFEEETVFSSILCAMVVFLLIPLVHWLLWSLSLYSFLCSCTGTNRRYFSERDTESSVWQRPQHETSANSETGMSL